MEETPYCSSLLVNSFSFKLTKFVKAIKLRAIRSTFQDSSEDLCQTEDLLKTKAIIPKTILSSPNLVVAKK